jgi:hypothetical protein
VRFLVTMNMPSYNGNAVHQMHVEHPAKTLEDFIKSLQDNDFVIVEEYYKIRESNGYESRGKIAISYRHIGKVKLMQGA